MDVKGLVSKYLKSQGIVATKNALGLNFTYEGWNFLFWKYSIAALYFASTSLDDRRASYCVWHAAMAAAASAIIANLFIIPA